MTKKIFSYLCLFVVFSMVSCSQDDKREYQIILEENDNAILSNFKNIDISPDQSKLLICDISLGDIYIYNIKNGKLIKHIHPDIFYSDTIANMLKNVELKKKKGLDIKKFNDRYVTFEEFYSSKGGIFKPDEMRKWIHNMYVSAKFIDDNTIYTLNDFKVNGLRTIGSVKDMWALIAVTASSIININNNIEQTQLLDGFYQYSDTNRYIYPWDHFLVLGENKTMYVETFYYAVPNDIHSDSIYSIGLYYLNGDFIKFVKRLPKEFIESNLFYDYYTPLVLRSQNNQVYFAYSNLTYIETKDEEIIQLKDFPAQFRMERYIKDREFLIYTLNDKNSLLDFSINGFFELQNENFLISSLIFNYSDNQKTIKYYQLTEYDKKGNLIRNKIIENKNYYFLSYIHYNRKKNQILLFWKSNEKGWTVEIKDY